MNIFNEGLIDTELFWLSFGGIISNMVISTVIIAEIGFVIWLLMRWLRGNVNINWSPVLNIEESDRRRFDSSVENASESWKDVDMGPIEVDMKKNIVVGNADGVNIKTDEIKRGKVKTQKNKLKKLIKG